MTEEHLQNLARVARIELSDAESSAVRAQLQDRLDALAPLLSAAVAGVPTSTTVAPVSTTTLRPDVPRPSLSQDDALRGAPGSLEGYFRVPRTQGDS